MSIDRMMNAGRVASVSDPHLQQLLDKQACAEVMMTYCRAIDHLDEALLRSVFHPDSHHRHGFEGPSSDPSRPSQPGVLRHAGRSATTPEPRRHAVSPPQRLHAAERSFKSVIGLYE